MSEAPLDADRLWKQVGDDTVVYDGWVRVSQRTSELPEGITHEVVHRDDLVVLP